jgi:hypothetical protein
MDEKVLNQKRPEYLMHRVQRERRSGVYPKFTADVLAERPQFCFDDVLHALGTALDKYNIRKTFSVISPRGVCGEEIIELIKKGAYEIIETPREIQIRVKSIKTPTQ